MQIEKWVHSVQTKYRKIYSLFCTQTLQAYVKTFAVNNNNISNIRVLLVEPDLCGIKVECHFIWDTLY